MTDWEQTQGTESITTTLASCGTVQRACAVMSVCMESVEPIAKEAEAQGLAKAHIRFVPVGEEGVDLAELTRSMCVSTKELEPAIDFWRRLDAVLWHVSKESGAGKAVVISRSHDDDQMICVDLTDAGDGAVGR